MQVLIWVANGILVGWLAGMLMKGRDYGWTGNLILGVLGGLVGGWVMRLLGFSAPNDLLRAGIVSVLGAMLVLGVARRLRPVARQTRRILGEVGSIADLEAQMRKLGDYERRALDRLLRRYATEKSPNETFEAQLTLGQRVADRVAKFGGSWTFIGLFALFMLIWMIVNTEVRTRFDPYPFILLNLVLSCLAAMQAPVIMMSQNRQAAKDRLMVTHDYEVNLRTEMELGKLQARFDVLRERDWQDLVTMQQRQIELLEAIIRDLKGEIEPGSTE
jgi:uncharacterized membrane protein/uncharacterized membrane protein YeaQ/YmgE (transglycosylase-associated protein family)